MKRFSKFLSVISLSVVVSLFAISVSAEKQEVSNTDISNNNYPIVVSECVKEISAEEYYLAKSEATGIPYDVLIAELPPQSQANTEIHHKLYTKTFAYPESPGYKVCLLGYFTIQGYGNYYDITEVGYVSTRMAEDSVAGDWIQNAAYATSVSASGCTLIAGGQFKDTYSISITVPGGFSVGTDGYIYSSQFKIRADVTVEMLKGAAEITRLYDNNK